MQPGPKPDLLKIDGDWKDAVKKSLEKKKPADGWRLYRIVKDGLDRVLKPEGIAICFGWNSLGFGLKRGYEMLEILMVTHGGAHNDTLVTVERKTTNPQFGLFEGGDKEGT